MADQQHSRTDKPSADYEQYWQDDEALLHNFLTSAVQFRVPSILSVYGGLSRPRRVLDYGCGNGALTYWLARCGFGEEILGIDISRTAIDRANARFQRPGLRFETFVPDTPLGHLGRFDAVVCSHVLEHLEDPLRAIDQMWDLSDLFIFEVPLEDCLVMNATAALKGVSRTAISDNHLQFWNSASFEAFLKKTGLLQLRKRIYGAGPYEEGASLLKVALQKPLLLASLSLYGRIYGTRYTALLWHDPLAKSPHRRHL